SDDKTNVVRAQLERLSTELTSAQVERINAESAWGDVQRTFLNTPQRKGQFEDFRAANSSYQASSALDDAQLRALMLQQESNLQVLQQRYLPGHPAIKNLQAYNDKLKFQYASAVRRRWETAMQ